MLGFLFKQHNNYLLEWYFDYGTFSINIKTLPKDSLLDDNLLIASYILFLARYFFICDEAQIDITKSYLLKIIKQRVDSDQTGELYQAILQTLEKSKQEAAMALFKIHNPFSMLPPLMYVEQNEKTYSYAKYDFHVFQMQGIGLGNIFNMSLGPDIVFLPITVSVLYNFIKDKLNNKDNIKVLNDSIEELLLAYEQIDCRSQDGFVNLPNDVIRRNKLYQNKL